MNHERRALGVIIAGERIDNLIDRAKGRMRDDDNSEEETPGATIEGSTDFANEK